MKRFALLFIAPTLLLLLAAVAPLVLGTGTLYTRDVLSGHFAMKSGQALLWAEGEMPLIDPSRGGGQPSMGNPNSLPLYPTNLLFLIASPLWALNAHFWLHWLLAPFAGFWLGRAWGLSHPAAWATGVTYATSGFLLSLFNLYNLIAGATLVPAVVAACLDAANPRRRRKTAWLEAGGLWGLMVLAGDPLYAALAAGLAATAVLVRGRVEPTQVTTPSPGGEATLPGKPHWRWPRPSILGALAGTTILGTLLAAPMLVEMARILPLSFRGYWQFSPSAALSQSWDPRTVVEWLLPFFFGRPDFAFWGFRFYGGNPPLLYSLYPGLVALALVGVAGRPRWRSRTLRDHGLVWAWMAMAGGLFLASGAHNPVIRALIHLPGASLLRYPVKCWLLVAVGGSLACGFGFARLAETEGWQRLKRALTVLAAAFAAAWLLLVILPGGLRSLLVGLDPQRFAAGLLDFELQRWRGLCLLSLGLLGALALAVALARRRVELAGGLVLALHIASQTFLLAPLVDSDDIERYRIQPPMLDVVPDGARIAHGSFGEAFGRPSVSPLEIYPDPRFFWLARHQFETLQPFAAVQWGLKTEAFHSPEGLDSFFLVSLSRALRRLDDAGRVRVLRASGVDTLVVDRPLDPETRDLVELRASFPRPGQTHFVYGIHDPAPELALLGSVRGAPHMDAALALLTDAEHDPAVTAIVPGAEEAVDQPSGEVTVHRSTTERLEATVHSPAGGVLVTQRGFLGIHRALVDDTLVEPVVVNGHRLGLRVPAGEHEVALWVDRRAYRVGWLAAVVGALLLLASPWAGRFGRRETEDGLVQPEIGDGGQDDG